MKRRITAAAACLLLILSIVGILPAAAVEQKVYDDAGLLTSPEITSLQLSAASLAQKHEMDVVIVTTNDNQGKGSMAYADDFYDYNGFGYGADHSGVLLLIDMEDRKVWMSTTGEAIRYFTDERIQTITDKVAGYLKEGDYGQGCKYFLRQVDSYIVQGIPANQHTVREKPTTLSGRLAYSARNLPIYLGAAVLVGAVVVAILIAVNKKQNTVNSATYLDRKSFQLKQKSDRFLTTTVTKHRIQSNSGGGSGASSTHTGSSGTSHGGGGSSF